MAQLKTGEPQNDSGNFAMLDIIKALQFVNAQHRARSAATRATSR